MSPELHDALQKIQSARAAGRNVALLFDYDGTLTPIVPHPTLAVLAAETRALLDRLTRLPKMSLGFLSGRKLDDLKAMVGLPNLFYAGTGGMELDLGNGVLTPLEAQEGRKLIASLLQPLDGITAYFRGAWLENKGLGLAVHYRSVAAEQVPFLEHEIVQLLQPLRGRVHFMQGPMAMEINPELGWTKATALRAIVQHIGPDTFPVYAGDAANDEDAMKEAVTLGGIALWVGPNASPHTPYQIPTPEELIQFLQQLDAAAV